MSDPLDQRTATSGEALTGKARVPRSASTDDGAPARDLAWQRWVQSRRQRKHLLIAQCVACLAAGILIGRGYSAVTAPPPPSPWWTIQFGEGGMIKGPATLMGADGSVKLRLQTGGSLSRDGRSLFWAGEGGEIRNLQLEPQDSAEVSQ